MFNGKRLDAFPQRSMWNRIERPEVIPCIYGYWFLTKVKRQFKGERIVFSINGSGGFPGGAVVGSLPANAGDTGSSPGLGRSHVPRSNWAREPQLLSLCVWSLCSAAREAAIVRGPAHRDEEWPPLATAGESPRTEMKTQHSQE